MNKKIIKIIIIVITIIFIVSYIVSNSGYYEYTLQQNTILTNEKIKEFEEDIKNNQNIDIKEYMINKELDYSNVVTRFMYNISDNSNKIARKTIKFIFKKLGSLIED